MLRRISVQLQELTDRNALARESVIPSVGQRQSLIPGQEREEMGIATRDSWFGSLGRVVSSTLQRSGESVELIEEKPKEDEKESEMPEESSSSENG